MNLTLASTAELYAEHRRTASAKKKLKIADELQRRHDELMGGRSWHCYMNIPKQCPTCGTMHWKGVYAPIARYDFRLLL